MALTTEDELQGRADNFDVGVPVALNSVPGGGTLGVKITCLVLNRS